MHVISMVWQWHLQDLDYSITKKFLYIVIEHEKTVYGLKYNFLDHILFLYAKKYEKQCNDRRRNEENMVAEREEVQLTEKKEDLQNKTQGEPE